MALTLATNNTKPDTDPLREALAAALKEATEARQAVERQRAGIERARTALRTAERAVPAAEKGVEEARAAHAQALANAAASDAAPPTSKVRQARQAVVDAQDEVEAAKGALDQLKADLPGWEEAARAAGIAVEAAISTVFAPHVRALLEKARAMTAEMAPVVQTLYSAFDRPPAAAVDSYAFEKGQKPLAEVRVEVTEFFRSFGVVDKNQAADVFRPAREKLRVDAFAPLPDLPR